MYINKITLNGFKWIDVLSGIKELTIDALNQVQIVIGANGGGKSATMSQITPLPASKNDYIRGGYKKLEFVHKGNEFIITSDFESKSGKHSFVMNGQELNINGLTTLQTDLCREYLNYTPLLDDLIHCRFKMCQMSLAERKALLLNLSPTTPEFVIQLHKQAKSALRACKTNLTMLHVRRAEIEEKMLPKEDLDKILQQKDALEKEQIKISNDIFLLTTRINEYKSELEKLGDVKPVSAERMLQFRKRIQQLAFKVETRFSPDEYDSTVIKFQSEIDSLNEKLQQLDKTYEQLKQELSNYNNDLLEQENTGQKECQELIDTKTKQLSELREAWDSYPLIREDQLPYHSQILSDIHELVMELDPRLRKGWEHLSKSSKVNNTLTRLNNIKNKNIGELTELQRQITKLQDFINQGPLGPKTILDNCTQCDLMMNFKNTKDNAEKELKNLSDMFSQLTIKQNKIDRVINRLMFIFETLQLQRTHAQKLQNVLSSTVWSRSFESVVDTLSGNRLDFYVHCQKTLQAQEYLATIKEIEKEVQEAKVTIETLKKLNAPAISMLKQLFATKQKQLSETSELIIELHKKIEHFQEQLTICDRLKHLYDSGERLEKEVEIWHQFVMIDEYVKFLTDGVLSQMQETKAAIDKDMYEFAQVIKEQENLKARYEEEILKLTTTIEKKQELYNYLEMGLSPESGMPHHQVLEFINSILENVNFIIGKIWTSSFKLELLQPTDEVTCDFKASINGKTPAQINKLSKSQQAVVNFAFYIALVYATGNTDYPIFFDECDDGFDKRHKETYLEWIKIYMESMYSPQLWMVCHDAALYSGFLYKDVVCLNKENIEVPPESNLHATIKHC